MKIDELKKAIRHLVREEVRKAVAEEVSKAMGKVLVEMVKEIKVNNPPKKVVEEEIEQPDETPILQTKNPKLNGVLAETARRYRPIPRDPDAPGLVELMDGGFDKIGGGQELGIAQPPQPVTKMDFLKQMVAQSPSANNQPSALDGGAEVPDMLKKVFKKDFRAVMKRMDEQRSGAAPGGFIDLSKVLVG